MWCINSASDVILSNILIKKKCLQIIILKKIKFIRKRADGIKTDNFLTVQTSKLSRIAIYYFISNVMLIVLYFKVTICIYIHICLLCVYVM